jgi:16S rRNA (cytosine1402-N4)-methyltransferase
MEHQPVLKGIVEKYLELKEGDEVVDATLGLGGHSLEIVKKIGKTGKLYAFEWDERNLKEAKKRLKEYSHQTIYFNDNFRYLKNRITEKGCKKVDAIFFDLGLSSPHVDEPERGFSFMHDGPLDMRFDQRLPLTAADVLNTYSESDLADIFFRYGEERYSKKVAYKICEYRKTNLFTSTLQLSKFLEKILFSFKPKKHPATKIFQALRIEVNDEINSLKDALQQAVELLKVGGRIVIISYHSLEDRAVKHFFKALLNPPVSPDQQVYRVHGDPIVESLTKKPVIPSEQELEQNPRSRSAKLRAYKLLIPIK